DVGVDHMVAHATGLDPSSLPENRLLARYEAPTPEPEILGSLPPLKGQIATPWVARLGAVVEGSRVCRHRVAHDVAMVRANLHRLPGFIRRRRAQLSGKRSAS